MTAETSVSSQPVLLDKLEAGVLTLTLNRPERLNALNAALIEALSAEIQRARTDPECRAVLITGAGRGFCAGADLANRAFAPGDARPDLGQALEKGLNPIIRGIRNLPKPVVCAVNGPAAGAGANIALACDIVLGAKSAQFLQAFARIGLIPDAGGTFVLPRLIGDARARALMMLAEPIGAERAEAIGMIYRAVADEDLMGEARTIAERLAAGPTNALGLMKRVLAASPTNSLDAQLDLERDLQREAGAGDEYLEGVRAFLDKRPANFRGKPPEA
ncbi:MAG TPA: 2-(1,2-epoxy-1,2-dihydrophenyl)acetyl-CoA isomerase PaaG [Roseiarcus sp.]